MTVKELIEKLNELPDYQKDLPVCYTDEVWIKRVKSVVMKRENEYGVEDDFDHIRLE